MNGHQAWGTRGWRAMPRAWTSDQASRWALETCRLRRLAPDVRSAAWRL